ncbi:tim44-like domain-containing protein [Ditylenchus destructor]|uniref:Mitochondrial import inner membrane translocase subunit TIM44 n=1 Tax=Ditylenchus destructor TaxID=166010 RepID=A0AAD4NB75_9BILA|nr:tim44-like domain-containing protein [Ditylenchus destructor]
MRSSRFLFYIAGRQCGSKVRVTTQPAVQFSTQHNRNTNDNFFKKLIGNVQEELARNKQLQESRKALEERLKELNNPEVRRKFDKIEKEAQESSQAIAHRLSEFSTYVNRMVTDLKSTEAAQEALKQAKAAAEAMEKAARVVGDTKVYKQVASTTKNVSMQIDNLADVRMYSRPEELKMRSSGYSTAASSRTFDANTEAQDIQLHKDSRWYAGWNSFVESNPYLNKIMDWKLRNFDESDNVAVRLLRGLSGRVADLFGSNNEVSEVLTEIAKVDPSFDKVEWLKFCEKEVVPNILEAMIRYDMDVLQDWCHERAFNVLSTMIKEFQKIGYSAKDSHIIDVSKMEMLSGKMMDQGPVLVITFQVFMIHVIKNMEGKVIEGDPNNPVRMHHVWVMCRDMEEFNPKMAWKLLEVHMQQGKLTI